MSKRMGFCVGEGNRRRAREMRLPESSHLCEAQRLWWKEEKAARIHRAEPRLRDFVFTGNINLFKSWWNHFFPLSEKSKEEAPCRNQHNPSPERWVAARLTGMLETWRPRKWLSVQITLADKPESKSQLCGLRLIIGFSLVLAPSVTLVLKQRGKCLPQGIGARMKWDLPETDSQKINAQ